MIALLLAVSLSPAAGDAMPPFRIADNLYYVGTADLASYLITSPEGHILIDGGLSSTAPMTAASIAKLGFKVKDVKILLNTQAHFDHAGGLAELKRLSGAKLMASDEDAHQLEGGGAEDFSLGDSGRFEPVLVDRRLRDGDTVKLGGRTLTAHLTPGHTKGCTTWTWDATDRGRTLHVVDVCGLAILDTTKLHGNMKYPQIASDYRRTFKTLRALDCEVFLGAHLSYFGGAAKVQKLRKNPRGPNPFIDPAGCKRFVDENERAFRKQLVAESLHR